MRYGFCSHERFRHIHISIASQSFAACVELPSFLQLVPVELCQSLNAFICLLDAYDFVHFQLVSVCGGVCCSVLVPLVTIERLVTAPRECWLCSTSLPGGNQVDGLPPAQSLSDHHALHTTPRSLSYLAVYKEA